VEHGETSDFLATVLPLMKAADTALHNGDPAERRAMWSQTESATLFGAAFTVSGWEDISSVFDRLGHQFSNCTSFAIEVIGAGVSGDLGYVAAIERTTASIGGRAPQYYALRVTTIFQLEDGEWKVVHRHGDPYEDAAGDLALRLRDD
jgi:ketosteroid isomerase-like protein